MKLLKASRLFDLSMAGGSHSEATRSLYARNIADLIDFTGNLKIKRVKLRHLQAWQDSLHQAMLGGSISPSTLHQKTRNVKRFFAWLVEAGYLPYSPASGLKLPRIPEADPKWISDDDLGKMLLAALESGTRDYALVRFLADTGCRKGGLISLKLSDLDLARGEATVVEKGHKARIVFFGDETADAIRAYFIERQWCSSSHCRACQYVFIGRQGPLTGWGVRQLLERLKKRAGVTGRANAHAFRHAWARRALDEGMDLGRVSRLLGHSDISVTAQFYARWSKNELREAHRKFNTMKRFNKQLP